MEQSEMRGLCALLANKGICLGVGNSAWCFEGSRRIAGLLRCLAAMPRGRSKGPSRGVQKVAMR